MLRPAPLLVGVFVSFASCRKDPTVYTPLPHDGLAAEGAGPKSDPGGERVLNLSLLPSDAAFAVALSDHGAEETANAEAGRRIVGKRRAYHARQGTLPTSLDALVPAELPALPPRGWAGLAPPLHTP